MSEPITTEWKSAFSYDNVDLDDVGGEVWPYEYKLAARVNGQYLAVSSQAPLVIQDGYVYDNNAYYQTSIRVYDAETATWNESHVTDGYDLSAYDYFPIILEDVTAQNQETGLDNYYSTAQFSSGDVYAPTGTYFDSIYLVDVLSGITSVLPVVLFVIIGFLAIRKGIAFLRGLIQRG